MNSFGEQMLGLGFWIKSKCREYRNSESKDKNVNEKLQPSSLNGGLCPLYGKFYNDVSVTKILKKIFLLKNTE